MWGILIRKSNASSKQMLLYRKKLNGTRKSIYKKAEAFTKKVAPDC